MKSSTTPEFWSAYTALPPAVKKAARKNYRLWLENPRHGSLQFQRKGKFWCAKVTAGYRALAVAIPDGWKLKKLKTRGRQNELGVRRLEDG